MPNWCSNCLTITPVDTDSASACEFMEWVDKASKGQDQGVVPPIIDMVTDSFFFEIGNVDEWSFQFESKWAPPLETMKILAQHYRFSFILEYEEWGMCMYGEHKYIFAEDPNEAKCLDRDVGMEDWPEEREDDSMHEQLEEILKAKPFTKL
jgi:hypothetical protein